MTRDRKMPDLQPAWPGRIAGDAGHDRIAACLVLDIQRAPDWGQAVLSRIDRVLGGAEDQWEMAMNVYKIRVGHDETDIVPLHVQGGEKSVSVRTADLRNALVAWCGQIAQK